MTNTRFVIHDHYARRAGHHWDLRIEKDKVLKSWAIPKHRMPEKGERLLAAQTPDHPLSWYDFEGEITDTYGRGTVKILEQEKCKIIKWKESHIGIEFQGKKIKGIYYLIKTTGNTNWIIIKGK